MPEEVEFAAAVKNLMRGLLRESRLSYKTFSKRLGVETTRLHYILETPTISSFARVLATLGYKPKIVLQKIPKPKVSKKATKKVSRKEVKVDESHPQPVPERV